MKIAVIGAGWAGLAAASELASAGVAVSVFEAGRQLGGRARSVTVHGETLDNGQHLLIGAYHETLRLMRLVGTDPEQLFKRMPLELAFPGSTPPFRLRLPRLPSPLHLACGLVAANGVSLREKIGAVRFMRALQTQDYRLDSDCTVADLLDRHRQHGSLRRHMWEPLCLAALNTEAVKASAQIFANVLRDSLGGSRADTDMLLPASDLGATFPKPAAGFIRAHGGEIHLGRRIDRIERHTDHPTGFMVEGIAFQQVILATAPQHAARLLLPLNETEGITRLLAGYDYEPICTIYAAYPPEVRLPSPMIGLNNSTDGGLGQWVIDRGACGGTPGLISFVLSAHGAWEKEDNATLAQVLHAELERALHKRLPAPRWHQVIREHRATFSCRPDLPRPGNRTPIPGLWLAGDYACAEYPATLEGAVRSGVAAARACLAEAGVKQKST